MDRRKENAPTTAIACLKLVELYPMTVPLVAGPALVYEDGEVTIFKSLQQMAATIVVEGLDTKRIPTIPPVEGIVDLPRSLWYELQAVCAQALKGKA